MSAYAAENRLRRWFTGEEHTNMKLTIPSNAEKILHILEENGYEAYVVGGCGRDSILGRNPNDWDITTSASPQQVKELFQRTVDTGLQHGTVTVLMDKEGYEVTTYRVDGDYEDGRHPKQVMFTSSLEEDLKRRDFTINAMAYHPERGLVDLFHGMEDMEHKSYAVSVIRWSVFMKMHFGSCVQCVFPHSWDLQLRKKQRLVFRHWHRI